MDTAEVLTVGQKISQGFTTFIIGFGIVFAVLILLIFIINIMCKAFTAKTKKPVATANASAPKVDPVPELVMEPDTAEDDDEVIAVIAAAVAAIAAQEGTRMKIRSFRRVEGGSQWARAGRVNNL